MHTPTLYALRYFSINGAAIPPPTRYGLRMKLLKKRRKDNWRKRNSKKPSPRKIHADCEYKMNALLLLSCIFRPVHGVTKFQNPLRHEIQNVGTGILFIRIFLPVPMKPKLTRQAHIHRYIIFGYICLHQGSYFVRVFTQRTLYPLKMLTLGKAGAP